MRIVSGVGRKIASRCAPVFIGCCIGVVDAAACPPPRFDLSAGFFSSSSFLLRHPELGFLKYVYLANPMAAIAMTFQRAIYGTDYNPALHPGQKGYQILPSFGVGGYALALCAVLAASVLLFLGALVVFGRLEGNFAEEL